MARHEENRRRTAYKEVTGVSRLWMTLDVLSERAARPPAPLPVAGSWHVTVGPATRPGPNGSQNSKQPVNSVAVPDRAADALTDKHDDT